MHDAGFKKMFSHPRMIELLIRRHIPDWADRIDYSTLEPLPTELIDRNLVRRYPDRLWRARITSEKTDLLLIIEFQARPYWFMALRTTIYAVLTAQSLVKEKAFRRKGRKLVVRTLVLHHGDRPWCAPTRLAELFRDSAPDTYRVVSPRPAGAPPPKPQDLPELVLGLARPWTPKRMRKELPVLRRVVEECGDEEFDRFMARTVRTMLESRGYSSRQLEEAMTMESVVTAYQRGLEEMMEEERLSLLRHMATRKFGPHTAEELPALLAHLPSPERIDRVADAIVDCDSSEEFLARVREGRSGRE